MFFFRCPVLKTSFLHFAALTTSHFHVFLLWLASASRFQNKCCAFSSGVLGVVFFFSWHISILSFTSHLLPRCTSLLPLRGTFSPESLYLKKQSCFVLQPPVITHATKINLCPADLPAPIANLYAAFLMALAFWHAQGHNGCGSLSCFSEAPSPLPPFQHVFTSLPCSSWVTSCQSEPWLFSVEGRRGSN